MKPQARPVPQTACLTLDLVQRLMVKERLVISSGLNSRNDHVQIEMLAQCFMAKFGGISGVAVK